MSDIDLALGCEQL